MEVGKLTVEYRGTIGKNEARRLRARGLVPGICYGPGQKPVPVSFDSKALQEALDPEKKQNTVIQMTVQGAGDGEQQLTVMVKEFQLDTLRSFIRHADFVTVDVTKDVTVDVPIVLTGRPVGVVNGGLLNAVYREIPVTCKPSDIPSKIEVDVSALDIGDTLHVSDVQMPTGVRAALGPGETVASVVAPKAEKTAAEEAAEAAAAAAETAAGAAPAEGAAAAPAAAAPAKAEGKPAKEEKKEK